VTVEPTKTLDLMKERYVLHKMAYQA
jgi:hypothetical protein